MFAIRTLIAIPAAVIACSGAVPVQAGMLRPRCGHRVARVVQLDQLDPWRVPCTLIPVPAAAPLGTGTA